MKTRIRDMLVIAAALIVGAASPAPAAWAAELLVVSQPNCSYCKAWDIEVGSVYARTDEARIAPLRRVRLDALAGSAYRFQEPVLYAPTFVLLDGATEIGRITGYSDASMFWGMLNQLLRKLAPESRAVTKTVANRSAHPDG
jgi:hypothetical protein